MEQYRYKSSLMTLDHQDDDCPICRFLNGGIDPVDMEATIRVLDEALAAKEQQCSRLVEIVTR